MKNRAARRTDAHPTAANIRYPALDETHRLPDEDCYSAAIRRLELEWAINEVEGRSSKSNGTSRRKRR